MDIYTHYGFFLPCKFNQNFANFMLRSKNQFRYYICEKLIINKKNFFLNINI